MLDPDDVPAQGGGQHFARGAHRRRRHRHHLPPETASPVATFLLFLNLPSLFCARRCFSAPHHDDDESLLPPEGSAVTKFPIRTAPRGTKHYTLKKACGWCRSSPSATSD